MFYIVKGGKNMKKIFVVILAVAIAIVSTIPVFAEESEEYDIVVNIAEVIVYDESINGVPDAFMNCLEVKASFRNIERFKSMSVMLDFNTELMRYETSLEEPIRTYIAGCFQTETGVGFSAKLGEMAVPGKSYSCVSTGYLRVTGTGEHNITMRVDVRDENNNSVDVKVKFKAPYEKIVDVSEVEFVNIEKFEMKYQNAMIKNGTRADELVGTDENKSAVVINSDGEVLENNTIVSNGAYIATLYEGYVADKIQICVMEDVNCDGKITAADARLALRYSAKLETLSMIQQLAADMNNDNKITAADARLILRKLACLDK